MRFFYVFLLLFCSGCFSTTVSERGPIGIPLDGIATKCNVGDEMEIGYPVPVIKKIQYGEVSYEWRIYRYDFKKNGWIHEDNRQSLDISPDSQGGGIGDNGDDFSTLRSELKKKCIRIKVLKKGLFLIKTFVEVTTFPEETDFAPELISSIVVSTIIDSRESPQPPRPQGLVFSFFHH